MYPPPKLLLSSSSPVDGSVADILIDPESIRRFSSDSLPSLSKEYVSPSDLPFFLCLSGLMPPEPRELRRLLAPWLSLNVCVRYPDWIRSSMFIWSGVKVRVPPRDMRNEIIRFEWNLISLYFKITFFQKYWTCWLFCVFFYWRFYITLF